MLGPNPKEICLKSQPENVPIRESQFDGHQVDRMSFSQEDDKEEGKEEKKEEEKEEEKEKEKEEDNENDGNLNATSSQEQPMATNEWTELKRICLKDFSKFK